MARCLNPSADFTALDRRCNRQCGGGRGSTVRRARGRQRCSAGGSARCALSLINSATGGCSRTLIAQGRVAGTDAGPHDLEARQRRRLTRISRRSHACASTDRCSGSWRQTRRVHDQELDGDDRER